MQGKILGIRTAPDGKTIIEIELIRPSMRFISDLIDWMLRYIDPVRLEDDKDRTPQEQLFPHKPYSPLDGIYVYACPGSPYFGTGDPIPPVTTTTTGAGVIINPVTTSNTINGEDNDK